MFTLFERPQELELHELGKASASELNHTASSMGI